jgi:hypothetical protein
MNSAIWLMAAARGGSVDPGMINAILKMEEEQQRKTEAVMLGLSKQVASGFRYLKGTPKIVDAAGKEVAPEDPRYAGILLKYKVEEDTKYEALQNLITGGVETVIELRRGSLGTTEFMARMMAGGSDASARPTAGSARFGG